MVQAEPIDTSSSEEQDILNAALRIVDDRPHAAPRPKPVAVPDAQEVQAEEAQEEQVEEEVQEEEKPVRKHKVKVKAEDGEDQELEVTEDDLIKGFMLEKDYRSKTAKLSKQREEADRKATEALSTKMKEYDDRLAMAADVIVQSIAPSLKGIDMNKLAVENPLEWTARQQEFMNAKSRLESINAERQKIAQAKDEETKVNLKRQVEHAVETLKERVPGWNDALYEKVLKTGREYGFQAQEVNAVTDPRLIEMFNDARQWKELKAKPASVNKVVTTPKVVKPGASPEKPAQAKTDWKAGMDRLGKSGRRDDAVPLALQILQREGFK